MSTPKMALTNKQLRPTPYARPFVSAATLQTTGGGAGGGKISRPGTVSSPATSTSSSLSTSASTTISKETIPVNDLVQLARKSFSSKDFDLALQYLTRALTLAPSNINLLDSRAACFEKLNRVPDALLDAKAMIKAHPQEPKGYLRAGKLFRVQQNLKSATKIFVAGVERSTKGSQEYETLVRIANDMRARMDQLAKKEAQILDPMDRLPFELIMIVFESFTFTERVRCLTISKKWSKYLSSVRHFWYSIELARRIPTRILVSDHAKYLPLQLDQENNYGITNQTVLRLIQHWKPKHLWLGCAQLCTGALLTQMTKMNRTSSIETFSLRLNHKVQSQEFSRLWSVTPKLRSLDLHGCSGVSDGVVQAVLARCPMLEELDISDCRVTEAFATSSFFSMETDIPPEPLPRMKKLVLGRWDVPISRQGVDTVVLRFPNLETLDLLAMRVLSITALESLSQLKQLKHLYTDSLETTSEEATFFVFQKWVEGIPNLESLQMSACKGLSDNCLHYMVAGSDNYANLAEATDRKGWSRSLRMLNFSLSPYLTNQGLVLLGTHSIPNLHTLILNKCGRLDENGMLSLVQGSGSGLTRLEFGGYRKCSDKLLFALRDHCPRISYLNLAHAGELSGIGLLSLVDARGRGLERICVDDCPYVGADAAERARTLLGDRSRVSYVFHRTYQS